MANISFGKLQGKLIAAEHYNVIDAAILTEVVIDKFSDDVRNAVLEWVDGKDIRSNEFDGVTVQDIIDEIGCSVFQALCILNALQEKPDCFDLATFYLKTDAVMEVSE